MDEPVISDWLDQKTKNEYKKKKNDELVFCNYCQREYKKYYWQEHLTSKKHINNVNLSDL